jgi:hypothetical protein
LKGCALYEWDDEISWCFSEAFVDISVWFWHFVGQQTNKEQLLQENYKYFNSFANLKGMLVSKHTP